MGWPFACWLWSGINCKAEARLDYDVYEFFSKYEQPIVICHRSVFALPHWWLQPMRWDCQLRGSRWWQSQSAAGFKRQGAVCRAVRVMSLDGHFVGRAIRRTGSLSDRYWDLVKFLPENPIAASLDHMLHTLSAFVDVLAVLTLWAAATMFVIGHRRRGLQAGLRVPSKRATSGQALAVRSPDATAMVPLARVERSAADGTGTGELPPTRRHTSLSEMARLQAIVQTSSGRAEAMAVAQAAARTQVAAAEEALGRLLEEMRAVVPAMAAARASAGSGMMPVIKAVPIVAIVEAGARRAA